MATIATIQRGSEVVSLPAGSGGLQQITKDVTITSIDLARSLLTFSHRMTKGHRSSIAPVYATAHLLNATTVRLQFSVEETNPLKDREACVEWQVTEYAA